MSERPEVVIAHVPVIHAGYIDFFENHSQADMHILNRDILTDYSHLRKDIRALSPEQSRDLVEYLNIFPAVKLLGKSALQSLSQETENRVIMPDDEVSRDLQQRYFHDHEVTLNPVFLQWNRDNSFVNVDVMPDRVIQANETHESVIHALYEAADKSSNWWRRVGAAIVGDDEELISIAHNHHLPTAYSSWIDGDPRSNAYRGVATEASTDQHAEASLIAEAAKEGNMIAGKSIFVTTFPCPPCSKLIAESGISACYFIEGYAMTDGQQVLQDHGVEVVKIEGVETQAPNSDGLKPYPKK